MASYTPTYSLATIRAEQWSRTYDRLENSQPRSFAERDSYLSENFRGDGIFPNYNLAKALEVDTYDQPGWAPFGVTDDYDGAILAIIKSDWQRNRKDYAAIDRLAPDGKSCFETTYEQCVRNLSASLVVSTPIGDYRTFPEQQRDINGKLKLKTASAKLLVRVPGDSNLVGYRTVALGYDASTGIVKEVEIGPYSEENQFEFSVRDTERDFKNTRLYLILSAINGVPLCDELGFYRFIHNDLARNPHSTGDHFTHAGGIISRRDSTRYGPRKFCGHIFEYAYGSNELASASTYSSGRFEYLSIKR